MTVIDSHHSASIHQVHHVDVQSGAWTIDLHATRRCTMYMVTTLSYISARVRGVLQHNTRLSCMHGANLTPSGIISMHVRAQNTTRKIVYMYLYQWKNVIAFLEVSSGPYDRKSGTAMAVAVVAAATALFRDSSNAMLLSVPLSAEIISPPRLIYQQHTFSWCCRVWSPCWLRRRLLTAHTC